jgi:Kef-type K+ transport system membrane component KefB
VSKYELNYPLVILMVGSVVFLVMLIKSGLDRTSVPSLVGFLILGFFIRLADDYLGFFTIGCEEIFGFLAQIGLFTLLFRVGLESNLRGLLGQLRRASVIWIANVIITGLIGFATAFYMLNYHWVASLVIATAFTATSVGISVAVWEESGMLNTPRGELLVDVAEMDDISAVVLMAMLFAVLPSLKSGSPPDWLPVISSVLGLFLIKLIGFGTLCFLFSRYAEKGLTHFFRDLESPPDPMLVVVAIGLMIAALAEMLGFSLAIGAFFAGLVFSRDPDSVKIESSFLPLYELLSPFFFIGIGLALDPAVMDTALGMGGILLVMAILGKLIANGVPVFLMGGIAGALLIGASMVPRAEIAMVIMHKGLSLGEWAIPSHAYAAMVVVSAATCILSPPVVRSLLNSRFLDGEAR